MKYLLEILSNFFKITGNELVDNIIIAFILALSGAIAFGFVGMLFDKTGHYDSDMMSGVHWIVRIIIFIALSFIGRCIAEIIKFLFGIKWWVYLIAFVLLLATIILIYILNYKRNKRKNEKINNNPVVENNNPINIEDSITNDSNISYHRDYCPRCGGKLVKRHGPYGDFYGCENYSTKHCTYTRKYK